MDTIRLSSGAVVRYRLVPPYARAQAYRSLPDPPQPTRELESVAGHVEEEIVPEDSPEYQEWFDEMRRVQIQRAQMQQDMTLDYGIVAWLLPPPDGFLGLVVRALRAVGIQHWRKDPPRGWEIPDSLSKYGVSGSSDRRLTYINLELVRTTDDLEKLVRIIGEIGEAGELTDEEVDAAEASFRDDVGRAAATGPTVTTDQERSDTGGDLGREEVGA